MKHEFIENLAGLAARVNTLAVNCRGPESAQLFELQERLGHLIVAVVRKALNEQQADYKKAEKAVRQALDEIGEARDDIRNVARVIELTAKAADAVEAIAKKLLTG